MSRWTQEQAQAWYASQPWLVGANFIPSTAINQLEMFQADTFDLTTMARELGYAADIGMNTMRVYLHDLLWADADGFCKRLDQFLDVAVRQGIRPVLCIFDDCWNDHAKPGLQPAPRTGIHNSGWLQSPGVHVVNDPSQWTRLEKYTKELLQRYSQDQRILMWDLYNEPGNNQQREKSLPFLRAVFDWAHAVRPSQPLSVGVWFDCEPLNEFQLAQSDVITFHNYHDAQNLETQITQLQALGRPLICTEWLRRIDVAGNTVGSSRVATNLPVFKKHKVGCINWGLVAGKTNTIYPWGSPENSPEPTVWFHDLFRADGSPFDATEIAVFRDLTAA